MVAYTILTDLAGNTAAYEAFPSGASESFIHLVQKQRAGWSSAFTIQNTGATTTTVTVHYQDYAGEDYTLAVGPGQNARVNQDDEAFLPVGYAGAAHLSSDQPIATVVELRRTGGLPGDRVTVYSAHPNSLLCAQRSDLLDDAAPPTSPLSLVQCDPVSGADFIWSPDPIPTGDMATFTGTVAAGTAPISYTWDFGDNCGASGQVVTHTYNAAGGYEVTMTATNCGGTGTDSLSHFVQLLQPLYYNIFFPFAPRYNLKKNEIQQAMFTSALAVQNLGQSEATVTITFYDLAGNHYAPPELGPGLSNPFSLPDGHTQEISLSQVVDLPDGVYGAVASSNQPIVGMATVEMEHEGAWCIPVSGADFSWEPSTIYMGEVVTLSGSAAGSSPIAYTWDFADGGTASGAQVTHTFALEGNYTVVMTASNCQGSAMVTATHQLQVSAPPPDMSPSYKVVSQAIVDRGDRWTYTLFLRNQTVVTATAVLTDPLPTHTTFISGSAGASDGSPVTFSDGQLHWSGQVAEGTPVIVEFAVEILTAPVGIHITNTAQLDNGVGTVTMLVVTSTYNPGYGLSINKGVLYTNEPTVTLRYAWNADDAITHIKISNDAGFGPGGGTTDWLPVDPDNPVYEDWVLATYGDLTLPRTAYVKFRDAIGQQFGPVQDDIICDPVPPGVGGLEIIPQLLGSLPGESIAGLSVILRITTSDDNSGVDTVHISHQADIDPYVAYDIPGSTVDIPWMLHPSGLVHVRAIDRAGNLSTVTTGQGPPSNYIVCLPLVVKQHEMR